MTDNEKQKTGYINMHSGCLYDVLTYTCCGYEHAESRTDPGATDIEQNYCPNCGAKILEKPPVRALFSIRPKYAGLILDGVKLVEYRRTKPARDIDEIIIYETIPVGEVVGKVKVATILADTPEEIWRMTDTFGHMKKKEFDKYFEGCKTAYAFVLVNPERFEFTRCLCDYGIDRAPQSFCYLKEDQK